MRGLAVVWVAALVLVGGCAERAPEVQRSSAPAVVSEFGGTDAAWVQLMIPMDEQLLPVLELVTQRGGDPALVGLAGELRSVYVAELPRLRALSTAAGLPAENPHQGHKMPGLVDAERFAALQQAQGGEFERLAVECLREHLDQLARLAGSEVANGTSPRVKALAGQVAENRGGASARLPQYR